MIDIDIKEMARLYFDEGLSLMEVGEEIGVSHDTVRTKLMEAGYTLRKSNRPRVHFDISEMVRLYFKEELSLAEVGDRMGTNGVTIRNKLIEAGYTLRKPNRGRLTRFSSVDISEMERLYLEENLSLNIIADRFNCSPGTVGNQLKKRGVRIRNVKTDKLQAIHSETYTPPKRFGKVFEPIPLLPPDEVTPERILQFRTEDDLTVDDIAAICSMSRVDIYNILRQNEGIVN